MKIKVDIGDPIKIPDELLKAFEKDLGRAIQQRELDDDSDLFLDFYSFCRDFVEEASSGCQAELVDEEIARFIANMETCFIPCDGGYPVEDYCDFKVGGKEYGVVAFGWTSDLDQKGCLTMIAYRNKRKKGEV